jgi:hypothetical protein
LAIFYKKKNRAEFFEKCFQTACSRLLSTLK